jgi:hypothetical protein
MSEKYGWIISAATVIIPLLIMLALVILWRRPSRSKPAPSVPSPSVSRSDYDRALALLAERLRAFIGYDGMVITPAEWTDEIPYVGSDGSVVIELIEPQGEYAINLRTRKITTHYGVMFPD